MLRVFPDKGTVLVEHVRVVKKTVSSKRGQRTKGGIAEQESPINISNVALICSNCETASMGYKVEGTSKQRICKKCGQRIAHEEVRKLLALSHQLCFAKPMGER